MRVHECKTICHVRTGERNKQKERQKKEEREKEKEKLKGGQRERKKVKISAEIFSESLLIFAHDKFPDDYTATFLLDSPTH